MISLKWGIIGPGSIAHDFARDLELVKPGQSIVAVLGHDAGRSKAFSEEFAIPRTYTKLEDFIAGAGVDIVYIATPHPQHYEQALACLENNIHVLCEKPLTLNAEQSAGLIRAAKKNKKFLMEAMWLRFLPSIQKVLELINDNAIGKILSVKAAIGYKAPKDDNNRYFDPEKGGGSLLDLGIYPIFLAHLLLGKPDTIKAIGSLTKEKVDEATAVLLDYRKSAHAILESSLLIQTEQPAEIAGENGIIRILNPWFEKSIGIELHVNGKEKEHFPMEWEGHGLQFEVAEILNCIQNNHIESDDFPHAFSLEISKTIDEIKDQINLVYTSYE